jgi:hypothetical protein
MTGRRFSASLLAGLAVATVLALAPSASAYDPLEYPASVDALNTYAPDATAAPANDGKHNIAVGGGQHGANFVGECSNSSGTCVNEGFAAQSNPDGTNPKGHVSATYKNPGPTKLRGNVTCLDVQGNEAFMLVLQSADAPGFPNGQLFLLHVIDNGDPVNGTPPDAISNRGPGNFEPPGSIIAVLLGHPCGYDPEVAPLERGNITVRDVS